MNWMDWKDSREIVRIVVCRVHVINLCRRVPSSVLTTELVTDEWLVSPSSGEQSGEWGCRGHKSLTLHIDLCPHFERTHKAFKHLNTPNICQRNRTVTREEAEREGGWFSTDCIDPMLMMTMRMTTMMMMITMAANFQTSPVLSNTPTHVHTHRHTRTSSRIMIANTSTIRHSLLSWDEAAIDYKTDRKGSPYDKTITSTLKVALAGWMRLSQRY